MMNGLIGIFRNITDSSRAKYVYKLLNATKGSSSFICQRGEREREKTFAS